MEIKTIKRINPEKWIKFKELAAKNNLPMGKLFEVIIEDYSKKDDSLWNLILGGEKTISDKEAKKMNETLKKMRKEKGFRNGFGL